MSRPARIIRNVGIGLGALIVMVVIAGLVVVKTDWFRETVRNVNYRGVNDQIAVQNSYLALPHSKLTLSGAVNKQLDVTFTSTDLDDLLAAASMSGAKLP